MTKHVVAAVRDLPTGSSKVVSVKGRPIEWRRGPRQAHGELGEHAHVTLVRHRSCKLLCQDDVVGIAEPSTLACSRRRGRPRGVNGVA
jgi:hypothetical protein